MKKIISTFATISIISMGFLAAKADLVSIDSILIMQKSQEGKSIAAKIQKDIEKFQTEVQSSQKELSDLKASIDKQAKLLSKDALQAKTEELANKKKDIEYKLSGKEESLKADIQKKQFALREKQLAVISEVSEKENWGMLVDKNTPGVLFVANAIDKTDLVLKAVDEKYSASLAKGTKSSKSLAAKNTTKAVATKTEAKKTVKAA